MNSLDNFYKNIVIGGGITCYSTIIIKKDKVTIYEISDTLGDLGHVNNRSLFQ